MKPRPHGSLERLLQDLEDGGLSAEGLANLENRLRHDPEARRHYREHMAFVSAMHSEAQARAAIEGRSLSTAEGAVRPRRAFARSVAAAAAVLLAAAMIALHIAAPDERAEISASAESVWQFTSGGLDDNHRLIEGSRLEVTRGTVRLTSARGTRVLVEGPADFEWKTPLAARLHAGRAWFQVDRRDIGFQVELDAATVTDLGTEFGLIREPSGDQVHVQTGRVRIDSKFKNERARELRAGEAAAIDPVGQSREIPNRSGDFLQMLPREPIAVRWSFERRDDDLLAADATGLADQPLELWGPDGRRREPVLIDGPFGQALDLGATGTAATSRFPGIASGLPRTVACWIKGQPMPLVTGDFGAVHPCLIRWGRPGDGGHKWQISLLHDGSGLSTQWGGAWVAASSPRSLLDGEWHHIASVHTGNPLPSGEPEILHYLDGQPLETMETRSVHPIQTQLEHPQSEPLSVGLPQIAGENGTPLTPVAIDELVIVRQALTASQIEGLYRNNQWKNTR